MPNKDATQPQPDSIKGLREEILEILPPSIYNDLTVTQLLELIQKAVTEGRLKELKELRDDPELDLQHYEYDRVDNELLNAQENGEQNIAVAVNDYLAERIATLKNQDKEG